MVKTEAWRGRRLHKGCRDHHAVVAIRDGRHVKSWRARRDTRCWEARTRSLEGAHTCAEMQTCLMAAAQAIPEPCSQAPDNIHDDLAQSAEHQEAKRRRLHATAEHGAAAEQPRIAGAIWCVGKRLSRIECRLRMRSAG